MEEKKRKSQQSLKLVPREQDRKKKNGRPQELEQSKCRNCGFQFCKVATSIGELAIWSLMLCSGLLGDSSLQDCPWNGKHRLPLAVCPWLLLLLLTSSSIYSDFQHRKPVLPTHSRECTNTPVRSPGQSLWPFFQKRKTGKNHLPGVMQVLKGNENLQTCSQPKCSSFWPSLLSEAKPLQATPWPCVGSWGLN